MNRADVLQKLTRLYQLAILRPGEGETRSNEARTAAFLMVQMANEHGIELFVPSPPEPQDSPPPPEPIRARCIRAQFQGYCRDCGQDYEAGTMVWWVRKSGCVHLGCDPETLR